MDKFFKMHNCERCGGTLEGGRTMSMFNTQCICMECAEKERKRPDYRKALEAERKAVAQGNRYFKGIGY